MTSDKCHFKQKRLKIPSDTEFKTHSELVKNLRHGDAKIRLSNLDDKFQSVTTSIAVVCPCESWIINPQIIHSYFNTHFIVAPRNNTQISPIESKWQDQELLQCRQSLTNDSNLVVSMISLESQSLFDNTPIFPYFTWDAEIRKHHGMGVCPKKFRIQVLSQFKNNQIVNIKGLTSLTTAVSKFAQSIHHDSFIACIVHLRLDKDYNVHVMDQCTREQVLCNSNLCLWFLFDKDTVKESLVIINSYKWLTLQDISLKHQPKASQHFNLNEVNKYYNHEQTFNVDKQTRISHVAANQLLELDAIWSQYISSVFKCTKRGMNSTLTHAAKYLTINSYYQNYLQIKLHNSCFNFEQLYIHHWDVPKNMQEQYDHTLSHFTPLFVETGIFRTKIKFQKNCPIKQQYDKIQKCDKYDSKFKCHLWLPDNLHFEYLKLPKKQQMVKYMQNLQQDYPLPTLRDFFELNGLMNILGDLYPQYIHNQWLMSVYMGIENKRYNLHTVDELGPTLYFNEGFSSIVIVGGHHSLLIVNDCTLIIDSDLEIIQVREHMSGSKGLIRLQGGRAGRLILVLRRIPIVHVEDASRVIDSSGSSWSFSETAEPPCKRAK